MITHVRNTVAGVGLVLHGLAHALPAMQIGAGTFLPVFRGLGIDTPIVWAATLLSSVAMTGFVAAGFGRLGAAAFRSHWRGVTLVAAGASLGLLLLWPTIWTIPGILIDVMIVVADRGWHAKVRRIVDTARALAGDREGVL